MELEDPLLIPTEKGLTARCEDIYLYPPDDPLGYAVKRARAAEIPPRTLVFVPSVGLGHGLGELLARLPEGCAILCVEAHQKIMALASAVGLPSDPRLTIIRTESEDAAAAVLSRMGTGRFRRVTQISLCAGYRLNPTLYARLSEVLASEIRTYWQNRMTLIAMGSLWMRNIFENMTLLPLSRDFGGLSTHKPIVVAGAGPSLEGSIPALRALRRKYLLAAVDTALPALAACGLRPDIVVVLEAQALNLADFLPYRDPSMPIACELSSHPQALRLFPSNLHFFSSAFAPLSLFNRLDASALLPRAFPALGSVGVAAVHAALSMTECDVVLTGLDFAYPDGRTHARGTPAHLAALGSCGRFHGVGQEAYASLLARPRMKERDRNGRLVTTDLVLASYARQLRRSIREDAGRTWEIGEIGLPLGARQASMEEIADRLSSVPELDERLIEPGGHAFDRARLRTFLEGEREMLARAEQAIEDGLSTGGPLPLPTASREAMRAVDYAFVHFPDEMDCEAPARSYLSRAHVAVGYYFERLPRVIARL
jgi:hypothetical protein